MHSSTVISAWKDGKLCGLVRVLDDSEMLAYVHYVLVNPKYQGLGIAGILLNWLKRSISEYSTHSEPHRPALRATHSII